MEIQIYTQYIHLWRFNCNHVASRRCFHLTPNSLPACTTINLKVNIFSCPRWQGIDFFPLGKRCPITGRKDLYTSYRHLIHIFQANNNITCCSTRSLVAISSETGDPSIGSIGLRVLIHILHRRGITSPHNRVTYLNESSKV